MGFLPSSLFVTHSLLWGNKVILGVKDKLVNTLG